MKNTLITLLSVICLNANAQIELKTPPPSPDAKWEQKVGFTTISIVYERPLMRGRKIFGGIVPFNEIWRTGAGESTRIRFSDDIEFAGQKVKKGYYSFFTIPNQNEWTVILNTDTTGHGAFSYDEKKDVLRTKIKPQASASTHEAFSIELNDVMPDYTASLCVAWENTQIIVPIKSNADEVVTNTINQKIVVEKLEDAKFFNNAAQYYFTNKKDLKQALAWSKKSEEMTPDNFYYANLSTKIYEELKDYPAAIKSAQKAIELGAKKNMKTTVANWQKKVEEWQILTGVPVTKPLEMASVPVAKSVETPATKTESVAKSTDLTTVFNNYFIVKDALVQTDGATASAKSAVLLDAIKAVKMEKLAMDVHVVWMKVLKDLQEDAGHIAETKDTAHQREHFMSLSKNVYALMKVSKYEQPVYYQYCPMANSGKGANWLSKDNAVKNPYYGSQMLSCGKTVEIIK